MYRNNTVIYIVHSKCECTLCSVHMYSVHCTCVLPTCTVFTVQCTCVLPTCNVHCIHVHCTVYTVHCTLHKNVHFTFYSVHMYIGHSTCKCTLWSEHMYTVHVYSLLQGTDRFLTVLNVHCTVGYEQVPAVPLLDRFKMASLKDFSSPSSPCTFYKQKLGLV